MSWEDDDIYTCQSCKNDSLVLPWGPKNSSILLVGDSPGDTELKTGKPFTGRNGTVLQSELRYLDVDMNQIRKVLLWQHEKNKNEKCLSLGEQTVLKEAKGKEMIILLGSDTVRHFTGFNVMSVTGLQVKSAHFSAPIVMACISPGIAYHSGIGELRLSIQKIAKQMREVMF